MDNLKPEMNKLIKKFDKKQKKLLRETMKGDFDKFTVNYSILGIALDDKLRKYSAKRIKAFYKVNNLKELKPSDIMLSIVIMTLTDITGMDVRTAFDEVFTSDPSQPELVFLANLVDKVNSEALVEV